MYNYLVLEKYTFRSNARVGNKMGKGAIPFCDKIYWSVKRTHGLVSRPSNLKLRTVLTLNRKIYSTQS